MKNALIIILLLTFSGCASSYHPWKGKPEVHQSTEEIEIVEDFTTKLRLNGVHAFIINKSGHHYLLFDTGFSITLIHDEACPNYSHQDRLEKRAKQNEINRNEGF